MKEGGPFAFTVSRSGGSSLAYGVMSGAIPNGLWIRAKSPLAVGMRVLFRCLAVHALSMTERVGEVVWVGEEQPSRADADEDCSRVVVCDEGRRAWIRFCEAEDAVAQGTSAS